MVNQTGKYIETVLTSVDTTYLDGKITKDMVEQQFKDKVKRKYRYLE